MDTRQRLIKRRGYTYVELLVSASIAAALVAASVPLIQQANIAAKAGAAVYQRIGSETVRLGEGLGQ